MAHYSPLQIDSVIFELAGDEYRALTVIDVIWPTDESAKVILESEDHRFAFDADALEQRIEDDDPTYVPSQYAGNDPAYDDEWIPHLRQADRDAEANQLERMQAPMSPRDLTFEKIEQTGSQTVVNDFLEGGRDGLVFHELGKVSSWRAAFVARDPDTGDIVSAITLHHYHPSTNGVELAITRVANHETAPINTSTWMIARARKWAERAGYERLATYAGVGGNAGVCYQAAGFEKVGEPVEVEGKDWKGDRADETWEKQKYIYDLNPDKYADKSEQWAVDSIAHGTITPGRQAYNASSPCTVVSKSY